MRLSPMRPTWNSRRRARRVTYASSAAPGSAGRGHAAGPLPLLPLLLLLAPEPACHSPAGNCGAVERGNDECPVDDCAESCQSIESGVACCIDHHGYGLDARDAEEVALSCTGEACSPDWHLTSQAAVCIAQVDGLDQGVGWCGAALVGEGDRWRWAVTNTTFETTCEPDDMYFFTSGTMVAVDSHTGAVAQGTTTTSATNLCP